MAEPASLPPAGPALELESLLRRCVQCGLCLPHCATWLATGNEVHGPRGRLLLLDEMLGAETAQGRDAAAAYHLAFAQCIGCRACEAACPSGVPYSLLEHGQQLVGSTPPALRGPAHAAAPGWLLERLDRPAWLRAISLLAGAAGWGLRHVLGRSWRRRLDRGESAAHLGRLVGTVPFGLADGDLLRRLDRLCGREPDPRPPPALPRPAEPDMLRDVAFFSGCANAGLLPQTSHRLRDLLASCGYRVTMPARQDCCGALAAHASRPGRAAQLRRRNREAFSAPSLADATIVAEAAGCGLELQSDLSAMALPVRDAVAFLAGASLPPLGAMPLTVAIHDPCHARHGQGIVAEPRSLLAAVPDLRVVESAEPEICCGSGGTWGLRFPELSEALGRRKADHLLATGADLIVTSNPGCLGQIADGLALAAPDGDTPVPIIPLTDLVWYAAIRARA